MFGFLNVDKPAGLTSRRVVDRVARLTKPAKAGHGGTLDPLATGVLVIAVGKATRLVPLLHEESKTYRARFLLGFTSDTCDVAGRLEETEKATPVGREEIAEILPRFTGEIEQRPPKFSAVHVNGKRAYKLARRGKSFELEPRRVVIHRLQLLSWEWPEFEIDVDCGSGTYIRSLGRDLGEALQCGAVMKALVRTRVGPFLLSTSQELDDLTTENISDRLEPARLAVGRLRQVECNDRDMHELRMGRAIDCRGRTDEVFNLDFSGVIAPGSKDRQVALIRPDGELAALAEYNAEKGTLAPRQVYLPMETD